MRSLVEEISSPCSPDSLAEQAQSLGGTVLLRTALFNSPDSRYSIVTAQPFLKFRSFGSRCEIKIGDHVRAQYGNPWSLLDLLMARFEIADALDMPFPLGGCFGYWGFDLKNFVEPKLPRRAANDLDLPDCDVGFYDSLVVFDHRLGKIWIVSTGLDADGSRSQIRAKTKLQSWIALLEDGSHTPDVSNISKVTPRREDRPEIVPSIKSSMTRTEFLAAVEKAQRYIRTGDIYQVNLSQRLTVSLTLTGWQLYKQLLSVSPAPHSAFYDSGMFQIVSSSPELFLRITGAQAQTRPIKGTRPRSSDPDRDARLNYELLTSQKELAELVMITDLMRNDLGKICEYGSVQVPELVTLERYPQVQHLVSTIEGRLRSDITHFHALSSCFPGGSVTGAPKIRALEIIDELEPVVRGPYTGSLGYLGFNRESQLSILIRTAICLNETIHFNVGAGIVADSDPAAEYEETLAKARGFLSAIQLRTRSERVGHP